MKTFRKKSYQEWTKLLKHLDLVYERTYGKDALEQMHKRVLEKIFPEIDFDQD